MGNNFIWHPDQNQLFDKSYNTQTLYGNDDNNYFAKNGGKNFTMDAEGNTLILVNSSYYVWPTDISGTTPGASEITLKNGNFKLKFTQPLGALAGVHFGKQEKLAIRLENAATMEIYAPLLALFGNEFELTMSGNSCFSVAQDNANPGIGKVGLAGNIYLNDHAECHINALGIPHLQDVVVEITDSAIFQYSTQRRAAILSGMPQFHLSQKGQLNFLVSDADKVPLEISEFPNDKVIFNFKNKADNKAQLTINNVGTEENKQQLLAKGSIAIDGVPQKVDNQLFFDFSEGDLKLSVR